MRIEWVNHASFIVESGPVRLICDPWLEGTAFNGGWSLLSPTRMSFDDFSAITHIWFSHEHPDHFSPSNLRKIAETHRRKIKVLFHHTRDKRVVNLCQSLGFVTEELPEDRAVHVAEDFRVVCGRQGLVDSWMGIFAENRTLLNMNDCVYGTKPELERIQRLVGRTDVLFSQFSYASWVGNPGDQAAHRKHADRKLKQMEMQIRAFVPAVFVPFASFVYFSHAENLFLNECVNRIGDVHEFAARDLKVPCNVLYPGDRWEAGMPWDSSPAIARYQLDFERAMSAAPGTSRSVSLAELQEAAREFVRRCSDENNRLLLKALHPAVIRLSDLELDVELSFRRGLVDAPGSPPDIVLSSDSLMYCFQTAWGGETLEINGRFQVPAGGRPRRFSRIFRVPRHNGYGSSLNFKFLGQQALQRARNAVAS